jgi:hypothetical protein
MPLDFIVRELYPFYNVFVPLKANEDLDPTHSPFSVEVFMRSFTKAVLPALAIGLFLIVGCSKDSSTNTTSTSPVGTWKATQSGATMTVVITASNTFTMDLAGLSTMAGNCSVSGNKVTFTYTNCTLLGSSITCSDPDVGTISGNTMTLPNNDGTTTTLTKQ